MAHTPVNHPLRPVYRVVGALAGLYALVFGIVGFARTSGSDWFAREDVWALGVRTNPAFSLLSIVAGAVILVGAVIGRNVDKAVNMAAAVVFLVIGTAMMLLMHTDANALNFSMTTCIVSYVVGLVLLTAALYGKVTAAEPAS